ncbi:hypothetical protein [Chamaesiphon sp.]|uniref:hypothetical protein n=1 Tax=Chamaesiphon sp. TaxID=2814140 RepID=UPI003594432A
MLSTAVLTIAVWTLVAMTDRSAHIRNYQPIAPTVRIMVIGFKICRFIIRSVAASGCRAGRYYLI